MKIKKFLAIVLSFVMVLGLCPTVSQPTVIEAASGTINLTDKSDDVSGATWNGNTLTISEDGNYTLTQTDVETTLSRNIIVNASCKVILNGVNIKSDSLVTYTNEDGSTNSSGSNKGVSAITVQNGSVLNLVLQANTTNTLKGIDANKASMANSAGIYVENNLTDLSSVIIESTTPGEGEKEGSLVCTGGTCAPGIGGNVNRATGNVTINSGVISTTGGSWGSGIGDGDTLTNGQGGDYKNGSWLNKFQKASITINGGYITATGGVDCSGIGCSNKLSDSQAGNANTEWDKLAILIAGGTVISVGGQYSYDNSTALGAGGSTLINKKDLLIRKGARVIASAQANAYALHNSGLSEDQSKPEMGYESDELTACVLSFKSPTTFDVSKLDYYKTLNYSEYQVVDGFPNSVLESLTQYTDVYSLAVTLDEGVYQVKKEENPILTGVTVTPGMVYGEIGALNVSPETATIPLGGQLQATAINGIADTVSTEWKSSDDTIASVNPVNGKITGVRVGGPVTITYTVTTSTGTKTDTCRVTVVKKENTADPVAPVLKNATTTSLEVNVVSGQEYSIDGGNNWNTTGLFTGLNPDTTYTVTTRIKEIETVKASTTVSDDFTTLREKPEAPVVNTKTATTITIQTKPGIEYSIDGGITWQTEGTFSNLTPDHDYSIIARYPSAGDKVASENSDATPAKTKKEAADPVAPVLKKIATTSLEVNVVSGQEYSIDGGNNWNTTGLFTGLNPDTTYTVTTRIKETETVAASTTVTDDFTTLREKPEAPVVKSVTATTITIETNPGIEYSIDGGINWKTEDTFSNLTPDHDYSIIARYPAAGDKVASENSDATPAKTKKEAADPVAPVLKNITTTSVEVNVVSGQEYSIDGGKNWNTTGSFTGLIPDTTYTVTTRIKETETTDASKTVSDDFTTLREKPEAPVVESKTATTITIETKPGIEYSINGGNTWQTEDTFSNLTPDHDYSIIARYPVAGDKVASENSDATVTKTKKVAADPVAPVLMNITTSSLVVNVVSGQEYSIDGGKNWNTTGSFTGLSPDTTYTVTTRIKETETVAASKTVSGDFTTLREKPEAPVVKSKTATTITIETKPGIEYSIDGGNTWQTEDTFTNLTPDQDYSIIARYPAAGDKVASVNSDATSANTKKEAEQPVAPVLSKATSTSLEVNVVSGQEYSIDGGKNWNTTGSFTGLNPNTTYTVTTRIKETETTDASNSVSGDFKTLANGVSEPQNQKVENNTPNSFTISTEPGYEYSIDGGKTWQVNGTFNNLAPEKEYEVVARKQATETQTAGEPVSILKVTTTGIAPTTTTTPTNVSKGNGADVDTSKITVTGVTFKDVKDGKITGVNADMEYSTDNGKSWKPCVGSAITGLGAGSVWLRYKETSTTNSGKAAKVTVKDSAVLNIPTITMSKVVGVGKKFSLKRVNITKDTIVSCVSSNKKIATVSKKGLIKGKKAGKATITVNVTKGKYSYQYTIHVSVKNKVSRNLNLVKYSTGSFKNPSIILYKRVFLNKSWKIKLLNMNKSAKITYKSSNKKVATVSKSGKVKGLKLGRSDVTVTVNDGGKTYKYFIVVRVSDPSKKEKIPSYLK